MITQVTANRQRHVRSLLFGAAIFCLLICLGARTALAQDPTSEPLPVLDLNNPAKSIVVLVGFDESGAATLMGSPTIAYTPPAARFGGPPQLMVRLLDAQGGRLEEYNQWHPLWNAHYERRLSDDISGDLRVHDPVYLLPTVVGRFVLPLNPDLRLMQLFDIPRGEQLLLEVDLHTVIAEYCADRLDDPACRSGPALFTTMARPTVTISNTTEVELRVSGIADLYGVQVTMTFDPTLLEVMDANSVQPGIQIEYGDFLVPDFVVMNQVDNRAGTIDFSMSFQGEKPGVDGGGVLARVRFHGLEVGRSRSAFGRTVLSDPQSVAIDHVALDGALRVEQRVEGEDSPGGPDGVSGQVRLERRQSNAGADICLDSTCITAAGDGSYGFPNIAPGDYTFTVARASYLRSQRRFAVTDRARTLPDVTLLGGDVNQDGHIEGRDAIAIGQAWNSGPFSPNWDQRADITDDDRVDILDMVAVQFNLDAAAPGPWAISTARLATDVVRHDLPAVDAQVLISPTQSLIGGIGQVATVGIRVHQVTDLYGFRLKLSFDPAVVRVVDADPSTPGVQFPSSDFLDPISQLAVIQTVDNTTGQIDLLMTQLYPAEACSGDGILATIPFRGVAAGTSVVALDYVQLINADLPDPQEIARQTHDGQIVVGANWIQYLPSILRR